MAFIKALKLIPHITKLVNSSSDKVKLLANWSVANMTSKGACLVSFFKNIEFLAHVGLGHKS